MSYGTGEPAKPITSIMNAAREIVYLSPPASVRMANCWFDIASVGHFWVRRRFEVLQTLAGNLIFNAREMAEFGCGSGLLQRQIEDSYGKKVTGFDLNEHALKQNLSRMSPVCCYDVFGRDPALRGKFDLIFLFDVLEHVDHADDFLKSVIHHLAPGGNLILNVPAGQCLYSAYDRADGHVRRYSYATIEDVVHRSGAEIAAWTYWGSPLLPLVAFRKLWLWRVRDEKKAISAGFELRSGALNKGLMRLARRESIPQHLAGTSLMAVLRIGRDR